MYFVYILELSNGKYYIGQTSNIKERMNRHQAGRSNYTKPYRPVKLNYYETFPTRSEAMSRERYLKSLKSRKALVEIMKSGNLIV